MAKINIKHLLITFDYELFLGKKSGSVEKCVINPTNKILSILNKYNAKAIFFVDAAWLVRLRETSENHPAAKESYNKVTAQLQEAIKNGHYVFNHLHPHWLDARYLPDINQWDLSDQTHYRFSSLAKEQKDSIFAQTTQILREIGNPVKPGYKANGYRAGGWSIQPFEDFSPYFQQYGIAFDFSIKPGMKSITTAQHYDFTGISIDHPYKFANDPVAPSNGDFTEFPITDIYVPSFLKPLNRVLLKYLWIKGDKHLFDGSGIAPKVLVETSVKTEMIAIELLTIVKLYSYLRLLKKSDYMQFISHPKMLSEHNINTFARFMKKAYAKYEIETDFRKMLPQ